MPYTLTQMKKPPATLPDGTKQKEQAALTLGEGKAFESFLLYFQFVIAASTKVVTVNYGRFAAYVSGTTAEAKLERPGSGVQNLPHQRRGQAAADPVPPPAPPLAPGRLQQRGEPPSPVGVCPRHPEGGLAE
jgi:hypothetical protein